MSDATHCPTCGHKLRARSKYSPLWDELDKLPVYGEFVFHIKNDLLPFNELDRHNWQEVYRRYKHGANRDKKFVLKDVPNAIIFMRLR